MRDGDTIELGSLAVRLSGLAAPDWNTPAGIQARKAMIELVHNRSVRCELDGTRTYDRYARICYLMGRRAVMMRLYMSFARRGELVRNRFPWHRCGRAGRRPWAASAHGPAQTPPVPGGLWRGHTAPTAEERDSAGSTASCSPTPISTTCSASVVWLQLWHCWKRATASPCTAARQRSARCAVC